MSSTQSKPQPPPLELVAAALDDHANAAVLGDWFLERVSVSEPWRDARVYGLIYDQLVAEFRDRQWQRLGPESDLERKLSSELSPERLAEWFDGNAAQPTPTFVRAVAAVLGFGQILPDAKDFGTALVRAQGFFTGDFIGDDSQLRPGFYVDRLMSSGFGFAAITNPSYRGISRVRVGRDLYAEVRRTQTLPAELIPADIDPASLLGVSVREDRNLGPREVRFE